MGSYGAFFCFDPSHPLAVSHTYLFRVIREFEPIPDEILCGPGSSVTGLTHTQTNNLIYSHSHLWGNLELPINLMCIISLDCGRNPELYCFETIMQTTAPLRRLLLS